MENVAGVDMLRIEGFIYKLVASWTTDGRGFRAH